MGGFFDSEAGSKAMTELKTRSDVLDALQKATTRDMSESEMHAQRVSFIMASLSKNSNITRHRVEEVLAQQDGRKHA